MDWGSEIQVDGKRPVWFDAKSDVSYCRGGNDWYGGDHRAGSGMWTERDILGNRDGWNSVTAIRLPATSPVYTALEAGFVLNPGHSKAPPADWDGSPVLNRGGYKFYLAAGLDWRIPHASNGPSSGDIIGYKRKAEAVEFQGSKTVTTMMTVKMVTETELFALLDGKGDPVNPNYAAGYRDAYRDLKLVLPPTRAETIAAATGVTIADVEKVLAEIVS